MFTPGTEIVADPPQWIPPAAPGDPFTIQVVLRQGTVVETIYFRIHGVDVRVPLLASEAVLPLALVPAMKLGSPLRISGPVSRRLLEGARRFQEVFSLWFPEFQRVAVHAEAADDSAGPPPAEGTGIFFSGGLDSSYSLLHHRNELTHAIFVIGCDIPLSNTAARDAAVTRLSETARHCGVSFVTVETDLLRFSDPFCHWGHHYHGAALAAIGLLFSGTLHTVYVASGASYNRIVPWGSSPMTDPLWSTPRLHVVHDGADKERHEKIPLVAGFPVALRNLRVCFENPASGLNCGQCEKCFRTMVGLRLWGALDACGVFDRPLDLDAMVAHPEVIEQFGKLRSWSLNRDIARRLASDPDLIHAMDQLHLQCSLRGLVRVLAQQKHEIVASPLWRSALPKFRSALFNSLRDEDPPWFTRKVLQWLPAARDQAFLRLANQDRLWFRKNVLRHRLCSLLHRFSRRRLNGD